MGESMTVFVKPDAQKYIEGGHNPSTGAIAVDLEALSEEDRKLLAKYVIAEQSGTGSWSDLSIPNLQPAAPTAEAILDAIRAFEKEQAEDARRRAELEQQALQTRRDHAKRILARREVSKGYANHWVENKPVTYKTLSIAWPRPDSSDELEDIINSAEAREWQAELDAANEASRAAALAEQARREQEKAAEQKEREDWIREHGSRRLKRCLEENIPYMAVYRDERLAHDRPGWEWCEHLPGELSAPVNPPDDAFDLLDKARQVDSGARLRSYRVEHEHDLNCPVDPAEKCPEYDVAMYVAAADFLDGRVIVLLPDVVDAEVIEED